MTLLIVRGSNVKPKVLLIFFLLYFCILVHLTTSTSTACPNAKRKSVNIICYVALWYEHPGFTNFNIGNLDPFLCTHIVGGYAGIDFKPNADDVRIFFGEETEVGRQLLMDSIVDLRKIHPSAEYILSVGGYNDWAQNKYCEMIERVGEKFVDAAIKKVHKHRADGIEFLWNWPGRASKGQESPGLQFEDVRCLRDLTIQLCKGMRKNGLICMITLRGLETYGNNNENLGEYMDYIADILSNADMINLWTDNLLDLNKQEGTFAQDFLKPDNLTVKYSETVAELSKFNVNQVIEFYKRVIQRSNYSMEELLDKLNMVIPMQWRAYGVLEENFNLSKALGIPDQRNDQHPLVNIDYRWQYPYFMICSRIQNQSEEKLFLHEYEELGGLAVAYNFDFKNGSHGLLIPTTTKKLVREKVKFAKRSGLGGVMVFQIAADDVGGFCYNQSYPLLNAIKDQVDECD